MNNLTIYAALLLLANLALYGDKLEKAFESAPEAIMGKWMIYGKMESGKSKFYGFSEGSIVVSPNQFKVTTPGWFSASNVGNFDICEKGSGKTSLKYDNIVDLYYLKFSRAPNGAPPLAHFALGRANRAQAFATFIALNKNGDPVICYLIRSNYLDALVNLSSKKKAKSVLEDSWKVRKRQIGVAIK